MAYQLITPATDFPVSIGTVKSHLRIDSEDDDLLLELLIAAAVDRWEHQTGYLLMPQTWEYVADGFPADHRDNIVRLHKCPLINVVSVSFLDAAGASQTMSPDSVLSDSVSRPARIAPLVSWPVAANRLNAVRIRFTAGHVSESNIPKAVRVALLMMIAHLYEHREEAAETSLSSVPHAVETVMNIYSFREHA